jgi:hypothetical protein
MPRFFEISDNTLSSKGYPWVSRIVDGLEQQSVCNECGGTTRYPEGSIRALLEPSKGTQWPDVLGCGAAPLLVVSERVLESWKLDGIGDFKRHGVELLHPLPTKLPPDHPPYSWIDGKSLCGAQVDFDKSGYVSWLVCPCCNRLIHDVSATYDRHHSARWPVAIRESTWNGSKLFTTSLSYTSFFCTVEVIESARRHGLTNFRFVPAEQANSGSAESMKYLGRKKPLF